jgi:DNA-binding transcriptional regulator YbjK
MRRSSSGSGARRAGKGAVLRLISLRDATDRVIGGEIEALRHRAMASAASLGITATAAWFRKLTTDDWTRRGAGSAHGSPWIQDVLNRASQP